MVRMKKILFAAISIIAVFIITVSLLNVEVTTRQGVDYTISTIKIPLYLKILDFYDRHYNYKWLVSRIVDSGRPDEEKVLAVLKWTVSNMTIQPSQLKVIDDHVWHIIVRRYGVEEQFQDVFCTLCNYAGINAFFEKIDGSSRQKVLSFVRLGNGWTIFDAYNGVYFKNGSGDYADIDDLERGDYKAVSIKDEPISQHYDDLFKNLRSIRYDDWTLRRAGLQSPVNRLIFMLKKTKLSR